MPASGIKRFVDRTALFLTLVGLSALLIGGVGVGNAVQAYLEAKTATIAILKCLGAPAAHDLLPSISSLIMLLALWRRCSSACSGRAGAVHRRAAALARGFGLDLAARGLSAGAGRKPPASACWWRLPFRCRR